MNASRSKVPAKAAEQSCVTVWRSAGFSTPSGLSLPGPLSPLVTWELLEWISVCLTGHKEGRGLGSRGPGSSALQNNRAGPTSPLTLQYVRELPLCFIPEVLHPTQTEGMYSKKKKSFLAGLLFSLLFPVFSSLICFFFLLLTHTVVLILFLISLSPSFLLQLLNTVFFILHYANSTVRPDKQPS